MATNYRILWSLALLFVLVSQFNCTSSKPEVTESPEGEYVGSVKANGQTSAMSMVTSQTATQLSGTYVISGSLNESGTVTGNLIGLIYNFTLKRTVPTAATFSTSVDISNGASRLVGTYGNGVYAFDLSKK